MGGVLVIFGVKYWEEFQSFIMSWNGRGFSHLQCNRVGGVSVMTMC